MVTKRGERTERITLNVSKAFKAIIRRLSEERGVSESAVCNDLIKKQLEAENSASSASDK